jgi:hypothetical protein
MIYSVVTLKTDEPRIKLQLSKSSLALGKLHAANQREQYTEATILKKFKKNGKISKEDIAAMPLYVSPPPPPPPPSLAEYGKDPRAQSRCQTSLSTG